MRSLDNFLAGISLRNNTVKRHALIGRHIPYLRNGQLSLSEHKLHQPAAQAGKGGITGKMGQTVNIHHINGDYRSPRKPGQANRKLSGPYAGLGSVSCHHYLLEHAMNPLLLFSGKDDSISICIPCLQFGCCYLYQSLGIELSPCLF